MARRETPVEISRPNHKGFEVQVQLVDSVYQLTYRGLIAQVRQDRTVVNAGFKYMRTCWKTEASAQLSCRKLNLFFNTDQFGYIEVDVFGNPEQGVTRWPK